ncbi:NAD-dependent epimerase/dehydratase family protein [Algoriphagus marincola]|uniref:NAD-dependent epimerase/dehydratase family protein n=1 Tax=Algoriphagus marincola TaxID=264027 RepID=UPI00041CB239|nr:NAD-dependent epimerase/dehydratase family protein [Algoriphagus marincola]
MSKFLVIGSAGFIGFHVVQSLLKSSQNSVVGIDLLNDTNDLELKKMRLEFQGIVLEKISSNSLCKSIFFRNYQFMELNLSKFDFIFSFIIREQFDYVIHLNDNNISFQAVKDLFQINRFNSHEFLNILEACRHSNVKHFVFSSTVDLFGLFNNNQLLELDKVLNTKGDLNYYNRENEIMAYYYSSVFKVPTTCIRFSSVFGAWSQSDSVIFKFTESIIKDRPVELICQGNIVLNFCYIDEVVRDIIQLTFNPPIESFEKKSNVYSTLKFDSPFNIFNGGNNVPMRLIDFLALVETSLGKKSIRNFIDSPNVLNKKIFSDLSTAEHAKSTYNENNMLDGINVFVKWYLEFYVRYMATEDFLYN